MSEERREIGSPVSHKESDKWGTPPDIIAAFVVNFAPDYDFCDAAASNANPLKASVYYTADNPCPPFKDIEANVVWCNPPYSKPDWWVAQTHGTPPQKELFMLLPASVGTAWYTSMQREASCFVNFSKRLAFVDIKGVVRKGNSFGSTLFYIGRRESLFENVFSMFGVVCRTS